MDFSFINDLTQALNSNNIYQFSFTGAKILALGLLALKVLDMFVKENFDNQELKIGNLASILGYGLIIMSSDWIITSIEDTFAGVDVAMQNTSSNLYKELDDLIRKKVTEMVGDAEDGWDYAGVILSNFFVMLSMVFAMLLGGLCKLADLVQRVFILQLLKFLFPLAIALSTYSGTQKLFHSWILRYIGIFILGIAYIGIINGTSLLQRALLNQFGADNSFGDGMSFSAGILITMIVTFTIKVKLFSSITSYVMGMFQ